MQQRVISNETTVRTPEEVALAYLRPYRERWVCPLDIVRLPPADFEGWHIVIQDETLTLTHGSEIHACSLKKLIVQIDKERGIFGRPYPATPRELARMLIYTGVERHEGVESIAYSHQGMGWYGYYVHVGGYVRRSGKLEMIDCWHIVVSEFEGEDCLYIFDLREMYREIELEIKQGFAIVQPTLF